MYKRQFFWWCVVISLGTMQAIPPRMVGLGKALAAASVVGVISSMAGYKAVLGPARRTVPVAGCGCERRSMLQSAQAQQKRLPWLQRRASGPDAYPGLQS